MNTAVVAETVPDKKEFWRWQENVWVDETKDWKSAKIVTCGIDVGSVSSQAVLMVDGELYGFNSMRTGNNSPDSATNALAGVSEVGKRTPAYHNVAGTVAALVLWRLLGWHWVLIPSFVVELLPVAELAPTWTAAVWWMTRGRRL